MPGTSLALSYYGKICGVLSLKSKLGLEVHGRI